MVGNIFQIEPSIHVGTCIRKFGYNAAVDASGPAEVDVIAADGLQTFLTSAADAADIDIASTSTADDGDPTSNTGAHTLTIEGLDADYMLQSETVTLNDLTDVHPVNDYLRIHRAFVISAGSGGKNAGTITIDVGGSNTLAVILPGHNQTLQAAYTIPANYKAGWLLGYDIHVDKKAAGAYIKAAIIIRPFGEVWQYKELFQASSDDHLTFAYKMPFRISPKSDIRLTVWDASADSLPVSGGFEIFLES